MTPLAGPADAAPADAGPADAGPEEVLAWAIERFGDRFAVVTSFQVEGLVVVDLARRVDPDVRVVTIDTGRLPEETFRMIDTVRSRLRVRVEVVMPDPDQVTAMTGRHGVNLFQRDPALRRLCCHARKVEPLNRVLAGLDAWATGLRRDGGPARAGTEMVERDTAHGGIVKINPLAHWTREQAQVYVREHGLPVHPLYQQGYTSIGCAPCTRAVEPGEGERAGRWWWEAPADASGAEDAKECGLHHRSPSERLDAAITELTDDVADLRRRRAVVPEGATR